MGKSFIDILRSIDSLVTLESNETCEQALIRKFVEVKEKLLLATNGLESSLKRDIESVLIKSFSSDNLLIKALNYYSLGQSVRAFECVKEYLAEINIFDGQSLKTIEGPFYRIRALSDEKQHLDRKGLFHIPKESRNNAKSCRFSVAGVPCLFLSTELSLCWYEMGMPSVFAASQYYLTSYFEDRYLLYLIPPYKYADEINREHIKNKKDYESVQSELLSYLRLLPLIMSCSIVKRREEARFSEEYIIPQLLMQWIIENREKNKIIGVYYTCCSTYSKQSILNAHNIAIPIIKYGENGYCEELQKGFVLTTPQNIMIKDILTQDKISVFQDFIRSYNEIAGEINSPNWLVFYDAIVGLEELMETWGVVAHNNQSVAILLELKGLFELLKDRNIIGLDKKEIPSIQQKVKAVYKKLSKMFNDLFRLDRNVQWGDKAYINGTPYKGSGKL